MEERRLLDAAAGFGGAEEARSRGAERLRAEVAVAGLRGRGGAAFPLWTKWEAALARPGPRVVVVNGAEDEPGSLKDRYLLATRPDLVVDGALCTALALDADRIVFYVNEEADGPIGSTRAAIDAVDAPTALDLVAAPAAYVFGEDSCAVEFIETGDRKAQPRSKPPFPAEAGVGGRPTVVSNAETLAHVALIARHGAEWFRQVGTPECPGTLLVTLPGECARPGVYEVAAGTPFADVLQHCGGGPAGAALRGAQVGGPAAGWLTADGFDTPLSPEAMAARGTMLGCAAVRLLCEDRCAVDAVAEVEAFFAAESCGKCPLCRAETQFFARAAGGLAGGKEVTVAHLDKAMELAEMARTTTDCALARFPAAPLRSGREHFPDDFAAHLAGDDCGRRHLGASPASPEGTGAASMAISGWPPPWFTPTEGTA
ncbi:MAG TPA: NADH-ubiquinone oxidoreductase-F iron-sulfur binding region domain-containing protein [Acidimicrobiia bacterium]